MTAKPAFPIEDLEVSAYQIPTDQPESDGTLEWDATTLILVRLRAGGKEGLGFTYGQASIGKLIEDKLASLIQGRDALAIGGNWIAMVRAIRNLGRPGMASMAIAAVDTAMWDLKAKLLGVALFTLLGAVRNEIAAYGSGGFTSYSIDKLQQQLANWAENGLRRVKMKIGRRPEEDVDRVRAARQAVGSGIELFVDANGAYQRKQALAQAQRFADLGVTWFEEPVSSDDLEGLRFLRDRGPAGMDIAAGEYGYDVHYFRRMLEAGSVDVLQADATRCGGPTGFLKAAALCDAFALPLSAHTAPSIHAQLCCSVGCACHVEFFHDHARVERMLFEGSIEPTGGELRPDPGRPGLGLELKRGDAQRYQI
jgi:L-alanine-DL-glutamate epimerase-like enolase superfamily enzyme